VTVILCLGEAIVDLICERELSEPGEADAFVPHPGGALANVAVAASRAGGEAALVGGVGDDAWGSWLREHLWHERVDVRWLADVEGLATPVAFVTFDWEREPTFAVYGEGIAGTMWAASRHLGDAISEATALVFGSNTLVGEPEREVTLEARRLARERGIPILFDPNLRPNRWRDLDAAIEVCRSLCAGAAVVRVKEEEGLLLTGERHAEAAAEGLCRLGAALGVVTEGPKGAVMRGAASAEGEPPPVEVVAPLGAGDAFMGALAAGLATRDWDLSEAGAALPEALAAGARACAGWSAQG
jgi:sugar/nucleoside kinase (ribokinase family)